MMVNNRPLGKHEEMSCWMFSESCRPDPTRKFLAEGEIVSSAESSDEACYRFRASFVASEFVDATRV